MDARDIPFGGEAERPDTTSRVFAEAGDQRYQMTVPTAGITFTAERVRRERHELHGELIVLVNGQFKQARTAPGGVLSIGDYNFSSVQMRSSRAKLLQGLAGDGLDWQDWHAILEDFTLRVFAAERKGKPAVLFADLPESSEETAAIWEIEGFPLLQTMPTVMFGDGGSGKSYFAMFLAGSLAGMGIPVVYADWEFSVGAHRERVGRMFKPIPRNLHYVKCDRPLKEETDRLARILRETGAKFLVADSIGFACDGPTESQEVAATYFRCLRQLGVGTLNISHIPKQNDERKEAQVFGSIYFRNGARSVWFVEKASENPIGQLRFGLHNRKNNVGDRLPSMAYSLTFDRGMTKVVKVNLNEIDEIVASLPILDRMRRLMATRTEAFTIKDLADELSTTQPIVRSMLSRHKSQFHKVGTKYTLAKGPNDLEF